MAEGRVSRSLVTVLLTLFLISCSQRDSDSTVWGGVARTSFSEWCPSVGIPNCVAPPVKDVPQKEWDSALEITSLELGSSSSFSMTRRDFENTHLQALLNAVGAAEILGVIKSFPWNTLTLDVGGFVLHNERNGVSAKVGSLEFRGAQDVTLKFDGKKIRISGIELVEPGQARVLQSLDLSKPGFATMNTNNLVVYDIPLSFFVCGDTQSSQENLHNDEAVMNVGDLVKAIVELSLDQDFAWREKLMFLLTRREIARFYAIFARFGPHDLVVESVMNAVASSDQVLFGGQGTENILSVSRKNGVSCSFQVVDVPVVRKLNLSLSFARGFGMAGLTRGDGDVLAKIASYGIETNFGKVKSIDIKADQMVLNVGVFHLPIDFVPKSNTGSPRVVDGKCTEN